MNYFCEIGMPVSLGERVGIRKEQELWELAMDATQNDITLSVIRSLNAEDVYQIFEMANR